MSICKSACEVCWKCVRHTAHKRFALSPCTDSVLPLSAVPTMATARRTIDPNVKAEVDALITGSGGKLTRWNKILEIFTEHGLVYKRVVQMNELLVHRMNRGGGLG